ncbi:MAG: Molybdate-binding periplasmic protein precursor [Pelotomaculum sp. PtaB.Bin013]|uniref:Molybdate ABC transporter substrate-binding protein n=1 Tax=Pelotomaculum isophthalicicum JI TaxID=947010 RepID=A0A9X4GXK9_9FIRM|nr:molybdate ABC transporter substrate-binding protein [Pelotomaculum isophthalicicum]MDF9406847.1 molybdate ABC transporter substrate-binding protein [Pelotomaculum isophthalicicum JI]OPX81478.1 MAG: Molybdate-binding periplasmic protein precursor [Pelotomaculum sp. PtaB.Bin013]
MKKPVLFLGIILIIMMVVTGCGSGKELENRAGTVSLTISAATSLKDAAEELKTIYVKQRPGIAIIYNFAASGTLQKQIEEGAPVDIFISAGKSQMDALAEKCLIVDNSRRDLLGNELVLIARKDSNLTGFESLIGKSVAKISIGTPETVPAGKYAKEALTTLKLWDEIETKLVLAKDARQVLTYIESGNVDAGIVYRSDVLAGRDIKIVAAVPEGTHEPIIYPMAVIKTAKYQKEAEELAAFLLSDEVARVFEKYNFKSIKN